MMKDKHTTRLLPQPPSPTSTATKDGLYLSTLGTCELVSPTNGRNGAAINNEENQRETQE